MKPIFFLFSTFILFICSCKKNNTTDPIDQLPPETQTGKNTFGCLVNGQAFLPSGAQLSGGSLSANYQLLDDGYYFRLSGVMGSGSNHSGIGLFTDSLKIHQGVTYSLDSFQRNKAYGRYFNSTYGNSTDSWIFDTKDLIYKGQLSITNLDTINQIVSGTFWFDAINLKQQKVEVRDGRFDVRYTR